MEDIKYMLGNKEDYKRFIYEQAIKHLRVFDKVLFICSRWNGLLWKAVYELRLKECMVLKTTEIHVKGFTMKTLVYVKIYESTYYYDNQRERIKFKKWVKENSK